MSRTVKEAIAQAEREGRVTSKVPFKSSLAGRAKRQRNVIPDHRLPVTEGWITLPWPPSVNHYWSRNRFGQTFLSKEAKDFHKRVANLLFANGLVAFGRKRIRVSMRIYQPTAGEHDIDNLRKAVNDTLQKIGLFESDSQIDEDHGYRGPVSHTAPRVEVLIEEIQEAGLFTEEAHD